MKSGGDRALEAFRELIAILLYFEKVADSVRLFKNNVRFYAKNWVLIGASRPVGNMLGCAKDILRMVEVILESHWKRWQTLVGEVYLAEVSPKNASSRAYRVPIEKDRFSDSWADGRERRVFPLGSAPVKMVLCYLGKVLC